MTNNEQPTKDEGFMLTVENSYFRIGEEHTTIKVLTNSRNIFK